MTGGDGGTFFGASHAGSSKSCLPRIIGGGGPDPFFFVELVIVVTVGFAGWLAMDAQVIFFAEPADSFFDPPSKRKLCKRCSILLFPPSC